MDNSLYWLENFMISLEILCFYFSDAIVSQVLDELGLGLTDQVQRSLFLHVYIFFIANMDVRMHIRD